MKIRRPERFSDSIIERVATLDRSLLEYHLETLTNRNQERDFETFCVKLAQFEICPNLRQQTGPVGGGDSKTDSESYPVSEFTSLNYWTGIPNSDGDRWAIAISAKKDWASKVKSDVKSIIGTAREYKKVFFITSQFARDKKRAELEDNLSTEYNVNLTILDRTWILDKVFTNKRENIAISELKMGDNLVEKISIGPLDLERERDFKALNISIEEDISTKDIGYKTIVDSLKAATIARELEKSQTEVYGLFERADRITRQYGSQEQLYSVKYEKAWTAFFWFEDQTTFLELTEQLESIAADTTNIFIAERQFNIINLLRSLGTSSEFDVSFYRTKSQNLRLLLNRFVNMETRPTAALQAKAYLVFLDLFGNLRDLEIVKSCFNLLGNIIDESSSMIGFPYESTIKIIQELGEAFGNINEFDKLLNKIIEIDIKRKGEVPSSISMLNFGLQHLVSNRIYKAIDYIGRSIGGLYKEESKDKLVNALYYISIAYERAGLLWAARGALLNAANYATSDFWMYNEINRMQARCYAKLKYMELRLGRISHALEWNQLHRILSSKLVRSEQEKEEIFKEVYYDFGMVLGCLIIKTPLQKLETLQQLPDTLIAEDLDFAAFGLLFLLNGDKNLPEEFRTTISEPLPEFFGRWLHQPVQKELADIPEYYDDKQIELKSKILGADYIVRLDNSSPGIELAESLLAAIESFLSTSISRNAISRVERVNINLVENNSIEDHIANPNMQAKIDNIILEYKSFDPNHISVSQAKKIVDVIFNTIAYVLSNTVVYDNTTEELTNLFSNERVNDRTNCVSSLVTTGNILGTNPKRSISQWIDTKNKIYIYEADTHRALKAPSNFQPEQPKDATNNETYNEDISHVDIKTYSVIDEELWRKASWRGAAFMDFGDINSRWPSALGLLFTDYSVGRQIFEKWKKEYGNKVSEHLEITILKGVNENHPFWYTMIINAKVKKDHSNPNKRIVMVYRIHTMTPENNNNLDRFLSSYNTMGHFYLAPAFANIETSEMPTIDEKLAILFKDITVKNAWEVGLHDLARAGISQEFRPYIPQDIKNAPVLQVLEAIKNNKSR